MDEECRPPTTEDQRISHITITRLDDKKDIGTAVWGKLISERPISICFNQGWSALNLSEPIVAGQQFKTTGFARISNVGPAFVEAYNLEAVNSFDPQKDTTLRFTQAANPILPNQSILYWPVGNPVSKL